MFLDIVNYKHGTCIPVYDYLVSIQIIDKCFRILAKFISYCPSISL